MATDTLTKSVIEGDASRPNIYRNFIDGEWVESDSGETFEDRNPADSRDVVGIFQKSNKADVDAAVDAAKQAFLKWRLVPAPRRAEIIYLAAEILFERKEENARDMTREMGKILKETRGDVQEAVDTAYYMAGEGRRMFGPTTPSELPNKFAMAVRQPGGVCGMITPWNFPIAIPARKLLPAPSGGHSALPANAAPQPAESSSRKVSIMPSLAVSSGELESCASATAWTKRRIWGPPSTSVSCKPICSTSMLARPKAPGLNVAATASALATINMDSSWSRRWSALWIQRCGSRRKKFLAR